MNELKQNEKVDRYPGLWPFKQSQAAIFFGREKEKRELFNRVRSAQVTILFAKSGTGKSSLLHAGVVPLLEQAGYLPLHVSFTKTGSAQRTDSPIDIIKNVLHPFARKRKCPFNYEEDSLWDYYKSCDITSSSTTPVLVFDQFEELFGYPADKVDRFLSELSELMHELPPSRFIEMLLAIDNEQRTPEHKAWVTQDPIKLVFAIRSDKLAELQRVDDIIPGLFMNRYHLLPMDEENARLSIVNPAKDTRTNYFTSESFSYETTALDRITKNLRSEITGEIEPYQLQIICRHIEEKVKSSYGTDGDTPIKEITINEFDADKEMDNVLHNYYEQQLTYVGNVEDQQLCRLLLEKELLEQSGNSYMRIRLSEGKIKNSLRNNMELVNKLQEARLIKPDMDESGIVYYQISHDSLIDPILRSKFESDAKEYELAKRAAAIDKARKLIDQHYILLKNKDLSGAISVLEQAEQLFCSVTDSQSAFEAGILITKVRESKREFDEANIKILELLKNETDLRNIGILNERLGVITSKKEGDDHRAFTYYDTALKHYESMCIFDNVARMSEYLGGIKEELFYNSQRDSDDVTITRNILDESENFYNKALTAYAVINDNFGYERVKRSLRRLQEDKVELETLGLSRKPWGYFVELFTGKVHALKGKGTIRMGRDVPNIKNEIGFQPKNNYLSRRHASITPDLVIEDTQSLNGTTINNIPLYYGSPRKLEEGDIVVLGNVMPMLFTISEPDLKKTPTDCWAIFIDGATRTPYFLTKAHKLYSVSVVEDENEYYQLAIEAAETDHTLMQLELAQSVRLFVKEKTFVASNLNIRQWKFHYTTKNNNRDYFNFEILPDKWYNAIVFPVQLKLIDLTNKEKGKVVHTDGPTFQLVLHEDYE